MDQVQQRKIVLIGSIGVGIVVIVGALVLLNYFSIVPLSRIAPGALGWLPVRSDTQETIIPASGSSKVTRTFITQSEVEGIRVEVQNGQELMKLLESWGTFKDLIQDNKGSSTNGKPVQKITIILTDVEQQEEKIGYEGEQGAYISSLTTVKPGQLDVKVHIDKKLLQDASKRDHLNLYLQTGFISAVYKLTHKPVEKGDAAKIRNQLDQVYKEIGNKQVRYFIVRK